MEREEAVARIRTLAGKDLRALAEELEITVWKDGKLNKGWVGHTIERFLGLPLNSSRSPNFGSWELKVASLRYRRNGQLRVKETMWLTMLDPVEVANKAFESSHLFTKMRRMLVVARVWESLAETKTLVYAAVPFDLNNPEIYGQVKADYDLIRETIKAEGFEALKSEMGVLVQPRTKGPGHGSTSRAFYARSRFVARILGLGSP